MRVHRLTILLFFAFLLFFLAGNPWLPITDPVESNYALTAKEMVMSGDWLSPQIYGQYWYDKPIMIYWLLALSFKIFGFTDWAARMPAGFLGAASVALMYQLMRTGTQRRLISLASAAIMGTTMLFWPVAHGIVTDMALLFTTVGTMGYAYRGLMQGSKKAMALAYIFAGLGVLTKGPVALVLPGILLLVFVAYQKSWSMLKTLFAWQGLLAFAVVALPWYIYMYSVHGMDFINGFLGLHNVTRATQSEHPEDNVWWYYLALTPAALMPWTGAFIYGLYAGWKSRTPGYMYCLIMGLGTVIFYSLMATKYPLYTFISLIPFSVIAAIGLVKALKPGTSKHLEWWLIIPALLLWIGYGVGSHFIKWGFWYLLYVLIAVFALGLLHFHLTRKRYMIPIAIVVGTMTISSVVISEGLIPLLNERSSTAIVAVAEEAPSDLYYYNGYSTSLVYYTDRPVTRIRPGAEDQGKDATAERSEAWKGKYTMPQIDADVLAEQVKAGKDVTVFVERKKDKCFANSPLSKVLHVKEVIGNVTVYTN